MPEHRDPAQPRISAQRRFSGRAPRTRSVVAATGLLILCGVPLADAATGGALREGVRNGTTVRETEIISNVGSTLTPTGGYATRQSNLSGTGGGAVYGCRSGVGGSAAKPRPQNPCVRANNLNTGYAFEFHASNGPITGLITAGGGGDTKKPFITNATGVATGLNADRVDNLDAAQIITAARVKTGLDADTLDGLDASSLQARFAQVTSGGSAGESRGLIATNPVDHANPGGVYGVKFTGDLTKCAWSATIRGTVGGEISVVPAFADGTTTVDVRTFDSAGAASERAFHLSANC